MLEEFFSLLAVLTGVEAGERRNDSSAGKKPAEKEAKDDAPITPGFILYDDAVINSLQSAATLVQTSATGTAVVIPVSKGLWETSDPAIFGWLEYIGKNKEKCWEVFCSDGVSVVPWHALKTFLLYPLPEKPAETSD
eukprot:4529858-Pleurochrysis_carterae.AAC.3